MLHYMSIAAAVTGVLFSNYAATHNSSRNKVIQWVLTIVFCCCCFAEVGWIGLFLSVFSPNVTDVALSLRRK
jgi:hypothetical protein